MKIAVLGMGGIGGVVGASLAKKFDDIYFIARGEALKVIKENGITLKSDKLGTFTAKPKLATDNVNDIGIVDVLIIATKSYSLAAACLQCVPIIGKDTVVLPLLNGVCVSDDIKDAIGDKGQIELSDLEEVEDLIEVGDLDIGQDIGIAKPEPGKDGGEHHHFRMGGTADAQQFKIPFLGDLPGDGVQFGENIPGHRIEGLSGGGQTHRMLVPEQELDTHLFLQALDMMGDSGH